MKKFAAFLLTLLMAISLVACAGNNESAETSSPDAASSVSEETSVPESETAQPGETEETEPAPETDTETEGAKILVAYFSATNTTEGVAGHISNGLNADLYEIVPEEPYTDADLNYNDDNSRSTLEMNDSSARPAISGSVENMEQYDIVLIGYPNWWYSCPMALLSFIESNDFSGKQIYLFCSHGTGGLARSVQDITAVLPDGNISENVFDAYEEESADSREAVREWLKEIGH